MIRGFKGFSNLWKCKDKKYEVGKTYVEKSAYLCFKGIHFCLFPLHIFNYYMPTDSKFALVETDEKNMSSDEADFDSKRVTKKLKIIKELNFTELINETVKYIENEDLRDNLRKYYNIVNAGIKISKKYWNSWNRNFIAISKVKESLTFTNAANSFSISSGYSSPAITSGAFSVAISRFLSICSGLFSISVLNGTSTKNVSITTNNRSISVVGKYGDCITTGNSSICALNTSSYSMTKSYGKNSIISSICSTDQYLESFGDNSIIAAHGTSGTKMTTNGKNSISIFYGNDIYKPSDTIIFRGKLGNLFIFPKYKKVIKSENLINEKIEIEIESFEIDGFIIKEIDNVEFEEDIDYVYSNGKFEKLW